MSNPKNHIWKVTVPESFAQTRLGLERKVGGTTAPFRKAVQFSSTYGFAFSFSFKRNWKPKLTRGARLGKRNWWRCAQPTRGAIPGSCAEDQGSQRPHRRRRARTRVPRSPGRSPRGAPLRPSWPRLLSPRAWTVPSLSSSSEWRSPLAACRSSALPDGPRRCSLPGPGPQQKYIPLPRWPPAQVWLPGLLRLPEVSDRRSAPPWSQPASCGTRPKEGCLGALRHPDASPYKCPGAERDPRFSQEKHPDGHPS